MQVTAVSWPDSYQLITQLLQRISNVTSATELQQTLQQSKIIQNQLQLLMWQNPAAAVAHLSLAIPQLPLSTARALKSWILLALWARLHAWPKVRQDRLGVCLLLACSTPQRHNKLPAALQWAKQIDTVAPDHSYANILSGCFHTQQQRQLWQVHPDSPLLTLALELGKALQPAANTAACLEKTLARKLCYTNDEFVIQQLKKLVELAPDLYLCGRVATDLDEQYWLLCQAQDEQWLALRYFPDSGKLSSQLQALPRAELTIQSPAQLDTTEWLQHTRLSWQAPAMPQTLRARLQHNLVQTVQHAALTTQLELLEQESAITQLLLQYAQQSNRQHLTVNRLRHALAMFGQTQLPQVLAQAELQHYLQTQGNPFHLWLLQLQKVLQHCLYTLSQQLAQPLTLQQSGLLALCCCVPLWHDPALFNVSYSRQQQGQLRLAKLCQAFLNHPTYCKKLSATLLQYYQFSDWAAVLLPSRNTSAPNMLTKQRTLLLRLSWQLAFCCYCSPEKTTDTTQLLLEAAPILSLPSDSLAYWQETAASSALLFYPLNPEN